jgi:hypothetical protein
MRMLFERLVGSTDEAGFNRNIARKSTLCTALTSGSTKKTWMTFANAIDLYEILTRQSNQESNPNPRHPSKASAFHAVRRAQRDQ